MKQGGQRRESARAVPTAKGWKRYVVTSSADGGGASGSWNRQKDGFSSRALRKKHSPADASILAQESLVRLLDYTTLSYRLFFS